MRDCIKRIVEKSNGALDKAAAKELLDSIDREAKRKVRDGFDYDESVKGILLERVQNITVNLKKQKENTIKNIAIKASTTDKLKSLIEQGLDIKDAFRADLEGINSPIKGVRDSLDVAKSAVESAYLSRMIGELNQKDLLQIMNSKKFEKEIGAELWALSEGKSVAENKQVKEIADIIFKTRESQRKRLNKAGADIGEVAGYVMPQRHDTFDMHKAGEQGWVDFMKPLIDEKRTFNGDYDNLDNALRNAYKALVTGIRLNDPTLKDTKLFQFTGPANLGKKLSQGREIHFKDFDSWAKWNEKFGSKDLNEGVLDALRHDSNNIALMERYGTNPEAMLNEVAKEVKKSYRGKAAEKNEQGIDAKIQSFIDAALEKNMLPANPTYARIGSNIRAFNNVTMLGGAVISSITDIPMKSLEYQFQGKTWLSSTVQPFMDIAQGFKNKKERIEFASLTGVGMESMIGDMASRFSPQDSLSSKAGKVQRMFFKLNGLAWWTDTHKQAMSRVMSHHLGLMKDTEFGSLDADTARMFGNYNISEADWNTMRQAVTKLDDGREYILPDSIKNEKLKEKLSGYFIDRANSGVLTPGVREQRIATFNTQRGTGVGETIRLMMQFKSFPITAVTKVWGRSLYGKGKADIPAMVYTMLMTAAFGYMAGAAKDLIKGKTPKDPTMKETIFASLAQGGGAGILGDLLFQDYAFGRSASSALAGPTFGRIDELAKLYSTGVRGEAKGAQLLKLGVSAIPFNNLFYTRAALDQMILLQMQEDLNPGYLRRMERNMKKTYGQEFIK